MSRSEAPNTPGYRGLLMLVITLGVLIVVGVVGLIVAAISGAGNRAPVNAAPYVSTLSAPGKHIESTQIDGNHILVRLTGTNGEELVILDANTGRVLARVAIDPKP